MRSVLNERRAALDAVHLVALVEQQLGQVGAVLAGDAGDQSRFFISPCLRRAACRISAYRNSRHFRAAPMA